MKYLSIFEYTMFQGSIEDKTSELTASESTSFSHLLSIQTADETSSSEDRYKNVLQSLNSGVQSYCYACNKITNCIYQTIW